MLGSRFQRALGSSRGDDSRRRPAPEAGPGVASFPRRTFARRHNLLHSVDQLLLVPPPRVRARLGGEPRPRRRTDRPGPGQLPPDGRR